MNDRVRSRRLGLGLSLASMFAVGFALHCGTDSRNGFDGPQCAGGLPEDCGKACNDDNGCGNGLHCSSALTCTAECGASVSCPTGSACSPRGRCEIVQVGQDAGDFGGGDGAVINPGDGAVPPDACADINVVLDKVTPTVLFLIDQSQSMSDNQFPANSGVTRWDALKAALIGNNGIIKKLENDVSFGVSIYSWEDQPMDPQCPMIISVPWKKANYTDINAVYSVAPTSDNTPTAESIMSVVGFDDAGVLNDAGFAGATTPGPKILVLATDGDPDTCADKDSNGTQGPRQFTVWATKQAYTAGISTYVISVGTEIDQVHQQQVANVGQGLPESQVQDAAPVYRPTDTTQLVDALNKVILGVRSCTFKVNGSIVPGTEEKGSVTLNATPLTYNDPNGWKLNSQTELEIVGSACQILKTTFDAQLQVRFPCGAVKPPPLPN